MRKGLSDEKLSQLSDYRTSDLPDSWKAAIALSEHLAGAPKGPLPATLDAELKLHYSASEILRLGALLAVGSGWQRMIEAFGIRPDHYDDGQDGPWAD